MKRRHRKLMRPFIRRSEGRQWIRRYLRRPVAAE